MKPYKYCLVLLSSVCAFILLIFSPSFVNSVFADVTWDIVEGANPNPETYANIINSIDHVSEDNIWSVGVSVFHTNSNDRHPLIEHYNGTNWSVISNPTGGEDGDLNSVSALSANDVWAVGNNDSGTLIEHYDGSGWEVVASPEIVTHNNIFLADVEAVAADNVWAVGSYINLATSGRETLIEHYDGTGWSLVSDGTSENLEQLNAITAVNANDIWAVGSSENTTTNTFNTLIKRWNGTSWSTVTSPNVDGMNYHSLNGVTALAENDIWAVGTFGDSSSRKPLIMHYNGSEWSIVSGSFSEDQGFHLSDVKATNATDIWAVGGNSFETYILHYNGTSWNRVESPNPNAIAKDLRTLTIISPTNIWVSGYSQDQTFFLHSSDETSPSENSPVIFIPGIMGSNFEVNEDFETNIESCEVDPYSYEQGDLVWQKTNILDAYNLYQNCNEGRYLDVLALDEDGQTPEYGQVVLNGSLPSVPYDDTISEFKELGYQPYQNLFYFTYDWRKDISGNMTALDNKINAIMATSSAQKVHIIAHSMGGLAAREYINDSSHAAKVDTLVTLGTPHAGAPQALSFLLYPNCIRMYVICVLNGKEVNRLTQNFTGFFELLPSKLYYELYPELVPFKDERDVDDNNVTGELTYSQTKAMLTNLDKNMDIFETAEEFHDTLDPDYSDTNGVATYLIAGSGNATIGQLVDHYSFNLGPIKHIKQDKIDINGDDTVPLLSATLGQQNNVYYVKQAHQDLASSDALEMAVRLLDGQTTTIDNVQTTPFKIRGKIFGIFSPVEIEAFDSNNNHTGKKQDGSFEEGIPGSSYTEVGESKFLYIPEGTDITIKTKATGDGPFDLKIKTYDDDVLVKEVLYLNINQNENTTAELSSDSDTPELIIDKNGDGTEVLHLSPSYVRTGKAVYDFSFPFDDEAKIAVSSQSGTITVGKPFIVDVTVHGGGNTFNAAQASIAVSPNLTITGLYTSNANACNFHYTQTPTKSNPSFAGAIVGSSSNECLVYKLALIPTSTGTGSITVSNASIKAYEDNTELLEITQNGIYQIDAPNPTPTPTASLQMLTVTSPDKTYKTSFTLKGGKDLKITSIYLNGANSNATFPTNTTWELQQSLTIGQNNFTLYGKDIAGNQTATITTTVNRHTLGDINGDGIIDLTDASLFAIDWDKTEDLTYILSDMNDDNSVDLTDLSILAKLQQ